MHLNDYPMCSGIYMSLGGAIQMLEYHIWRISLTTSDIVARICVQFRSNWDGRSTFVGAVEIRRSCQVSIH